MSFPTGLEKFTLILLSRHATHAIEIWCLFFGTPGFGIFPILLLDCHEAIAISNPTSPRDTAKSKCGVGEMFNPNYNSLFPLSFTGHLLASLKEPF
jgi:hypothetical protein